MKRRVLILAPGRAGSPAMSVWARVQVLLSADYEVTVICPGDERPGPDTEALAGLRVVYGPDYAARGSGWLARSLQLGCAVFQTWWAFIRHSFDAIQGMNPPDHLFMIAVPFKLFGVKYVYEQRVTAPADGRRTRFEAWNEDYAFRAADVVLVGSAAGRAAALDRDLAAEDIFMADAEDPDAAGKALLAAYDRVYVKVKQEAEARKAI